MEQLQLDSHCDFADNVKKYCLERMITGNSIIAKLEENSPTQRESPGSEQMVSRRLTRSPTFDEALAEAEKMMPTEPSPPASPPPIRVGSPKSKREIMKAFSMPKGGKRKLQSYLVVCARV